MRLHIERLVIDGFAMTGAEAVSVQAAVEAELAAGLMGSLRTSWTSLSVPRLALDPIRLTPNAGPEQLGGMVGAALHDGLLK